MPLSTVLGAQSLVQPAVCTTATRPASPYTGQAIYDTTVAALLIWSGTAWTGTGGLQLVTTATCSSGGTAVGGVVTIGSAVSSVTVATAFSAAYDAYKIIVSGGVCSTSADMRLQLGSETTLYNHQLVYGSWNATTTAAGASAQSNFTRAGAGTTSYIQMNAEIINPFLAKNTFLNASLIDLSLGGSIVGIHTGTTSFTAFTILPSAGTMTGGTIRVYGYQNS